MKNNLIKLENRHIKRNKLCPIDLKKAAVWTVVSVVMSLAAAWIAGSVVERRKRR